jgi:hypothetical protein
MCISTGAHLDEMRFVWDPQHRVDCVSVASCWPSEMDSAQPTSADLAYLSALLHYSNDALLAFDVEQHHLLVRNRAATQLLGWQELDTDKATTLQDAIGRLMAASGSDATRFLLESIADGESYTRAADYDASRKRQLLVSAKLFKGALVQCILMKVTDMTSSGTTEPCHGFDPSRGLWLA